MSFSIELLLIPPGVGLFFKKDRSKFDPFKEQVTLNRNDLKFKSGPS